MRILHTSDWHLGQNFYGYDRQEEHAALFQQLCDIARKTKPDAMVVCGDIFHNYTPSAEAQRLYTEGVLSIHNAAPDMEIIITAGNHDSATRLEVDSKLWELANVHVVGKLKYNDNGQIDFTSLLFRIGNKGYVFALPYIFSQSFPADPDGLVKDNRRYFFNELNKFMNATNRDGLPTVLMAHIAVQGSELKGQRLKGLSEGVGGIDFLPADAFGEAFDYVALGHIHHPQTIHGTNHRVRYSGSPIPVSFDEDYQHSVSIVDIEHGKEPEINYKDYAIDNPIPLLTIPKEPQKTPLAMDSLRKQTPTSGKCYVRFNPLERKAFPVTMEQDVIDALKTINEEARYTTFIPNLTKGASSMLQGIDITPGQLVAMEPMDIVKQYFDLIEEDFSEYEDLFKQVVERINKEQTR